METAVAPPRKRTRWRKPEKLRLPPRGRLTRTGSVDFVDDYYGPGLGWVLRQRLRWVRDALPQDRVARVLEIGYGSGIFFYELSRRADTVVGIDVHGHASSVQRQVRADGMNPPLVRADGMELPFQDGAFDVVIILSALEFMSDPGVCLRESLRVLRPGGQVIGVRPRASRVIDLAFRMLAGIDPEQDFRGGRERVQHALADLSSRAECHPRPAVLTRALAPYELFIIHRGQSRPEAPPDARPDAIS